MVRAIRIPKQFSRESLVSRLLIFDSLGTLCLRMKKNKTRFFHAGRKIWTLEHFIQERSTKYVYNFTAVKSTKHEHVQSGDPIIYYYRTSDFL